MWGDPEDVGEPSSEDPRSDQGRTLVPEVSAITRTSVTQDAQGKPTETTQVTVPLSGADLAALGKTLGSANIRNLGQWLQKSLNVVECETLSVWEWHRLLRACVTPEIQAAMDQEDSFGGDNILQSIVGLGISLGRKTFKGQFGASHQTPGEPVRDYVIQCVVLGLLSGMVLPLDKENKRTSDIRSIDYPPGFWKEVQEGMHQPIIGLMGPLRETGRYVLGEVLARAQDAEKLIGCQGGAIAATQFKEKLNDTPNYMVTYSIESAYPKTDTGVGGPNYCPSPHWVNPRVSKEREGKWDSVSSVEVFNAAWGTEREMA
ncbi:uncharacterized protein LOC132249241 [Alligator mississippiensis]|uniref:uncharacterized protein LOC132249241 n=1 Tax=Alligator mississippiensis TaxID=8496 RepID=UPI00287737FE|nr:uncharacterized protein LOC132249241 [Alligator mississippiensis]